MGITCHHCNGNNNINCSYCGGTGEIHYTCSHCLGAGCQKCGNVG